MDGWLATIIHANIGISPGNRGIREPLLKRENLQEGHLFPLFFFFPLTLLHPLLSLLLCVCLSPLIVFFSVLFLLQTFASIPSTTSRDSPIVFSTNDIISRTTTCLSFARIPFPVDRATDDIVYE